MINIYKKLFVYLLIGLSVVSADNCKNFLTMQGDGQEMSIMLCLNNIPNTPNISKTNLSNSTLDDDFDIDNFNNTNNDFNNSIDLLDPISNVTDLDNSTNLPIVEPATTTPSSDSTTSTTTPSPTTPSPTTPSPTTPSPTTPSPTTPSPTTPSATTTDSGSLPILDSNANLRGTNKNSSNASNLQKTSQPVNETVLEDGIIAVIVICVCLTLFSVSTLIIVLCKHKKCCDKKCCDKKHNPEETKKQDIESQEPIKKPKGRRVSPTNDKIEQLQYTNTYRNSRKLKNSSTTLSAVERLKQFRERNPNHRHERESYPRVPPGMKPLPKDPPPRLPPPAPEIAMKQAHKIMERKNRNSWSIKELPNNAQNKHPTTPEIPTDEILKTNGSHDLSKLH